MTYEVKSIHPGSVFVNALRIFCVVGFLIGVLTFFILENPNLALPQWWQKTLVTILFTGVYTVVVSVVLTLIALLYNLWGQNFSGIKIHVEQTEE